MKPKEINILKRFEIGLRRCVSKALDEHKRMGHYIVVMRDGKVTKIQPEDIVVPPYPDDSEIID